MCVNDKLAKRSYSRCTSSVPGAATNGELGANPVLIGIWNDAYWLEKSAASRSRSPVGSATRKNWSDVADASCSASSDGVSRPRFVRRELSASVTCARPTPRCCTRRASDEPCSPAPSVSAPPAACSVPPLMTLTIAPCREPPNSAGNAPVKISIACALRGSMSCAKFELVDCGSGAPSSS